MQDNHTISLKEGLSFPEKYREDLTQYLLSICTDAGLLKGTLLSSLIGEYTIGDLCFQSFSKNISCAFPSFPI